jgi:hypothetical protein
MFRCVLICTAVVIIATSLVWLLTRDQLPYELRRYLNQRHSEIVSDGGLPQLLFLLLPVVLFVTSLIGLFFFWPPARVFYCGSILTGIVEVVSVGPRVTTGPVAALGEVVSILLGVILYMVFYSPIREEFRRNLPRSGPGHTITPPPPS